MHTTEEHKTGIVTRRLRNSKGALPWSLLIGIAVVVLAAGLVGGILGTSSSSSKASSASAQSSQVPHPPANHVLYSQGWTVHNYSGYALQYVGFQSSNGGDLEGGGPPVGTVIQPNGGQLNFQQVYFYNALGLSTSVELDFFSPYSDGHFSFTLTDDGYNNASASADPGTSGFGLTVGDPLNGDSRALDVG